MISNNINNSETDISGDGTVGLSSVTQDKLTISSGIVNVQAQDLIISDTINNSGTLNLSGTGALTSAISGTGTTNINDSFSTEQNIEQNNISVAEGKTFTTSGDTSVNNTLANSGTIANSGILTINAATGNTGTITYEPAESIDYEPAKATITNTKNAY